MVGHLTVPVIILNFDSKDEIIDNADHNRLPNGAYGQANIDYKYCNLPPMPF